MPSNIGADTATRDRAAISLYRRRTLALLLSTLTVVAGALFSLLLHLELQWLVLAVLCASGGAVILCLAAFHAWSLRQDWLSGKVIESPATLVRVVRVSHRTMYAWDAGGRQVEVRRAVVPWDAHVGDQAIVRYLPASGVIVSVVRRAG